MGQVLCPIFPALRRLLNGTENRPLSHFLSRYSSASPSRITSGMVTMENTVVMAKIWDAYR